MRNEAGSTATVEPSWEPAATSPAEPPVDTAIHPLDVLRVLRTAGGSLLAQAGLYGQLIEVEWALEKRRLQHLLLVALLGFACLLCLLLLVTGLVLALTWQTPYRFPAALLLLALFGVGLAIAVRRFQLLSAQRQQTFAALREELSRDIALLKSQL